LFYIKNVGIQRKVSVERRKINSTNNSQRRNARSRERRLWLKTAPREETFSMLYAGNGDHAPDAIIYDMLIDEPAIYLLGRYEQKGCWV